jgi:FkbM family methyltransferase
MKIVNKIIGIIQILISPKGGIRYLISRTRSVASFGINSVLHKIDSSIKTIIDVGANVGQYAYATFTFYPDAIIHSFEPVPETFAQLKLNTHKIEKIKVYSCALGDSEGTIDFFQNEHSHASSALEVSIEQKEALPETKNYKKIQVPVHKLDDFDFGVSLEKPILLKMDVQGFEMQVLQGGNNFLKSVEYILLEMSFVQMYKNEPLFDEMHQYIKEKGFVLVGPVGSLPSGNQQIMQMDMLYRKK